MTKDLELKLVEKYPVLFQEYTLPMTQTCMCWGCCCEDGWYSILDELFEKLSEYQVVLGQVKEKFGGLRVYINPVDKEHADKIYDLINEAERKSYITCEKCSKPGTLRTDGWHRTLCDECESERGKQLEGEGGFDITRIRIIN